jgi:phosphatidylserine/phosphatidylglycerophosphate/cardiolipin synthase-like enzyme
LKKAATSRRKLVDWLGPRKEFGPLRAVVGTSYEFTQEFFETDFLPNLLDLGAWNERHWTSRIALERHLSDLKVATVFIDAACYRGRPDSLRVSMSPVALGRGRSLHAKVLLLVYEDAIRLFVGSANLTENGYRRNREVASVLTCTPDFGDQAHIIAEGIEGLRARVATWPAKGCTAVLDEAAARIASWAGSSRPAEQPSDQFAWSDRDHPLWRTFADAWPRGQRIKRVSILSPFWSDEGAAGPLSLLLAALRERAPFDPGADLRLLTDAFPVARETFVPVLPESFGTFDARGLGLQASVWTVDPRIDPRDVDVEDFEGLRALHAKAVVVEGDKETLAYVGSANFTRRGWGFGGGGAAENANIEAGLILRRPAAAALTERVLPATVGRPVPLDGTAAGKVRNPEPLADDQPWPGFILEVTLVPRQDDARVLDLHVSYAAGSGVWSVRVPSDSASPSESLHASEGAADAGVLVLPLSAPLLARILVEREVEIVWGDPASVRRFPVNVDPSARDGLPVAPGDVRPGEAMLLSYYQGRLAWEDLYPEPGAAGGPEASASKAAATVDTSRIRSYQIREFVEALNGIRADLRTAAQSGSAMALALRGPVSPVALAKAVAEAVREQGRTPVAACFQLVEILAILRDAATFAVPRYHDEWTSLLALTRREIEDILTRLKASNPEPFRARGAFARYERAVMKPPAAPEETT